MNYMPHEVPATDMWDDPVASLRSEASRESLSIARDAVAPLWPYLEASVSREDFGHRLALSEESFVSALMRRQAQGSFLMAEPSEYVAHIASEYTQRFNTERLPVVQAAARLRDVLALSASDLNSGDRVSLRADSGDTWTGTVTVVYKNDVGVRWDDQFTDAQPGRYSPAKMEKTSVKIAALAQCPSCNSLTQHTGNVCGECLHANPNVKTASGDTCATCGGKITLGTGIKGDKVYSEWTHAKVPGDRHKASPKTGAKTASGGWIDAARQAASGGGHQTVDGMMLDQFTASMLVQIHDALNGDNQARFEALPLEKAVDMGWKLSQPKAGSKTAGQTCPSCKEDTLNWVPVEGGGKDEDGEDKKAQYCSNCDYGVGDVEKHGSRKTAEQTFKVGDRISGTSMGYTHTYEVVRITPAGFGGSSYNDGPTYHAAIVGEDGNVIPNGYVASIWSGSMSDPTSKYTKVGSRRTAAQTCQYDSGSATGNQSMCSKPATNMLTYSNGSLHGLTLAVCDYHLKAAQGAIASESKVEKIGSRRTASGPIAWRGDSHMGASFVSGKADNGDIYEAYFNPNMNPTPCSWVNYGPKGDTGPNSGIDQGRGFTTLIDAMRAAESAAGAKKTSSLDEAQRQILAMNLPPRTAGGDGTEATVMALPLCDVCGAEASYDAKTVMGPWAYLCAKDFGEIGSGLGTGKGQKLVLAPKQGASWAVQAVNESAEGADRYQHTPTPAVPSWIHDAWGTGDKPSDEDTKRGLVGGGPVPNPFEKTLTTIHKSAQAVAEAGRVMADFQHSEIGGGFGGNLEGTQQSSGIDIDHPAVTSRPRTMPSNPTQHMVTVQQDVLPATQPMGDPMGADPMGGMGGVGDQGGMANPLQPTQDQRMAARRQKIATTALRENTDLDMGQALALADKVMADYPEMLKSAASAAGHEHDRDKDLTIAYPKSGPNSGYAELHQTGCNHLNRTNRYSDPSHVGTGFEPYADDYFEVAPCARKKA